MGNIVLHLEGVFNADAIVTRPGAGLDLVFTRHVSSRSDTDDVVSRIKLVAVVVEELGEQLTR